MAQSGNSISDRKERLKSNRLVWESHWQELLDNVMPRLGRIIARNTPGEKRQQNLLDSTAMHDNELLAGALHSMLTNPFSTWFDLITGIEEIDNDENARKWLQKTGRTIHGILNESNFHPEIHEMYLELGCLGTAPLLVEEDDDLVVRFSAKCISSVYISENHLGVVDELYRPFMWTAKQIVERFGPAEKLPRKIKEAYDRGLATKFEIIHAVYPKDRYPEDLTQNIVGDFASVYYACEDRANLEEKGFYEFPYVVPRWTKLADEEYGRSPGMVALPEAKLINKITETMLKAAQKVVDPPLQAPDDGFVMPIKLTPGGMNFFRAGGQDRIEPLFKHDMNINFGYQMMDQIRERIHKAFYTDQLQAAPMKSGNPETATAINQRAEESLRMLGPMLGRQTIEFASPLIYRVFKIAERRNLIDPAPEIIKRAKGVLVRYSSLIARAQRASEADGIFKTLQAISPFINIDPKVVDNFDGDAAVKYIAGVYNFPQDMIVPQAKRDQVREAKAKAQQQALQMQQEQHAADMAQKTAPAMQAMNQQ